MAGKGGPAPGPKKTPMSGQGNTKKPIGGFGAGGKSGGESKTKGG